MLAEIVWKCLVALAMFLFVYKMMFKSETRYIQSEGNDFFKGKKFLFRIFKRRRKSDR